jgi:hypothetical protein
MKGPAHPPRDCPVCGEELNVTRLSCEGCGTELSGLFHACEFCSLRPEQRELLRVFLSARGNLKELERHLGVSYPTARARFAELLSALDIEAAEAETERLKTLQALAAGEIEVGDALERLGGTP